MFFAIEILSKAWLLYDAYHRRAEGFWYAVILVPMGQWVYLFVVKRHDYDLTLLNETFERRPSVASIRAAAEHAPSFDRKLHLAQALLAAGHPVDAAHEFDAVLQVDPRDQDALYGLALCHVRVGTYAESERLLAETIELREGYADYEPWFDLALSRWRLGYPDAALETLAQLTERAPRIKHKVVYARFLLRAGRDEPAQQLLREALNDYRGSTGFIKRTCGRWARIARALRRAV